MPPSRMFVVIARPAPAFSTRIEEIATVCQRYAKGLLIDTVASFGAIDIDARKLRFDALTISSNKCMQGVPGIGWAVVQKQVLENAKGTCPSLALDLWGPESAYGPHEVRSAFHAAHADPGGLRASLPRA